MSCSHLRTPLKCVYCQEKIQGRHIKCVECSDFDICLECFSMGAEIGPHKKNHSYEFIDSSALAGISLENGDIKLLDAMERFGYGSWDDIASHLETKTPAEVRDMYLSTYLDGILGDTWGEVQRTNYPSLNYDENIEETLHPNDVARELPPLNVSSYQAAQLGYMSKRDEYKFEYDPEAEQLISNLSLNSGGDELDDALKLSQVHVYTRRLRERMKRKRLVREHQLVSVFFKNQKGKKKNKEKVADEKQMFTDRFLWTAQHYGCAEQAAMVENLWREQELRNRLAELNRCRLAGITRHEEVAHYTQEAAKRSAKITELANEDKGNVTASTSLTNIPDPTTTLCSESTSRTNSACSTPASLLSAKEEQLCKRLKLKPTQYLTRKSTLLRQPAKGKTNRSIQQYLQSAGWVRE